MLKISIFVAIALGLTACDNSLSKAEIAKEKKREERYERKEAMAAEAKATCRRNMGSCSLDETCDTGIQLRIEGVPDRSREIENCKARWNAATSRERGAAQCEQLTSKMLYDICISDLR